MKGLFSAFKNAIILDEKEHKDIKVKFPEDFSFMERVEVIPLGFSEIIPASLFYPIFFGIQENEIFPFAVCGFKGKNVYLNPDGSWKINMIPKICELFPFGVINRENEYLVVIEKDYISEEGERLWDEFGEETEFFKGVKKKLTEFVKDYMDAVEFAKELMDAGCLKQVNLEFDTVFGKVSFKNVMIGDIAGIYRLAPERLYHLNYKGYLPVLYGVYYSVRNFELFKFIAPEFFKKVNKIEESSSSGFFPSSFMEKKQENSFEKGLIS